MDFLGVNISFYLILLAAILTIIGFVTLDDISMWISYFFIALVATKEISIRTGDLVVTILLNVLFFIVLYGLAIVFHYKILKKFTSSVVNKYIAPDKRKDGLSGFVGSIGEIKEVEGKLFIKLNGEILLFTSKDNFQDQDKGRVVGNSEGVLLIEKV